MQYPSYIYKFKYKCLQSDTASSLKYAPISDVLLQVKSTSLVGGIMAPISDQQKCMIRGQIDGR
jgi:hypothetical protein